MFLGMQIFEDFKASMSQKFVPKAMYLMYECTYDMGKKWNEMSIGILKAYKYCHVVDRMIHRVT